jgi:hypothetical protein
MDSNRIINEDYLIPLQKEIIFIPKNKIQIDENP